MRHVYDWLADPSATEGERFAKEFLLQATRPAMFADRRWLEANPLFCTFEGRRYRCTGASRLGDVWLTDDFAESWGYALRVDVDGCSAWGKTP